MGMGLREALAFIGVVQGVCVFVYLNVHLVALVGEQLGLQDPGDAAFPPCPQQKPWYTTGSVETLDRFMCIIVPFFRRGVDGPIAAANMVDFAGIIFLFALRLAHSFSTASSRFVGPWIALVVCALGQLVGIGATGPLIAVPVYVLNAHKLRRTAVPQSTASTLSVLSVGWLLGCSVFLLWPADSYLVSLLAVVFQPFPLLYFAPVMLSGLFSSRSVASRASSARNMAALYRYFAGVCTALHAVACLHVVQKLLASAGGESFLVLLQGAWATTWANAMARFLLVDHASLSACLLFMLVAEARSGRVSAILQVVLRAPLLSLAGAISLHYAQMEDEAALVHGKKQ